MRALSSLIELYQHIGMRLEQASHVELKLSGAIKNRTIPAILTVYLRDGRFFNEPLTIPQETGVELFNDFDEMIDNPETFTSLIVRPRYVICIDRCPTTDFKFEISVSPDFNAHDFIKYRSIEDIRQSYPLALFTIMIGRKDRSFVAPELEKNPTVPSQEQAPVQPAVQTAHVPGMSLVSEPTIKESTTSIKADNFLKHLMEQATQHCESDVTAGTAPDDDTPLDVGGFNEKAEQEAQRLHNETMQNLKKALEAQMAKNQMDDFTETDEDEDVQYE